MAEHHALHTKAMQTDCCCVAVHRRDGRTILGSSLIATVIRLAILSIDQLIHVGCAWSYRKQPLMITLRGSIIITLVPGGARLYENSNIPASVTCVIVVTLSCLPVNNTTWWLFFRKGLLAPSSYFNYRTTKPPFLIGITDLVWKWCRTVNIGATPHDTKGIPR